MTEPLNEKKENVGLSDSNAGLCPALTTEKTMVDKCNGCWAKAVIDGSVHCAAPKCHKEAPSDNAKAEPLEDHQIIALMPRAWTGTLAQTMEFARRIEAAHGVGHNVKLRG